MDCRHRHRPGRRTPLSTASATERGLRRAAAARGDAARLRAGRERIRPQHPYEPPCSARALHGALPGTRPAGQPARLLELVRHRQPARLCRGGHHQCRRRPGVRALPCRPGPGSARRHVGRGQHGSADGRAHTDALPGRCHALGRAAGHGPLGADGAARDARARCASGGLGVIGNHGATRQPAPERHQRPARRRCPLAATARHPRQRRPRRRAEQRRSRSPALGRRGRCRAHSKPHGAARPTPRDGGDRLQMPGAVRW